MLRGIDKPLSLNPGLGWARGLSWCTLQYQSQPQHGAVARLGMVTVRWNIYHQKLEISSSGKKGGILERGHAWKVSGFWTICSWFCSSWQGRTHPTLHLYHRCSLPCQLSISHPFKMRICSSRSLSLGSLRVRMSENTLLTLPDLSSCHQWHSPSPIFAPSRDQRRSVQLGPELCSWHRTFSTAPVTVSSCVYL